MVARVAVAKTQMDSHYIRPLTIPIPGQAQFTSPSAKQNERRKVSQHTSCENKNNKCNRDETAATTTTEKLTIKTKIKCKRMARLTYEQNGASVRARLLHKSRTNEKQSDAYAPIKACQHPNRTNRISHSLIVALVGVRALRLIKYVMHRIKKRCCVRQHCSVWEIAFSLHPPIDMLHDTNCATSGRNDRE